MKTQPWKELHTPVPQSWKAKAVPAPLHVNNVLPLQRREPGVQIWGGGTGMQRPLEQLLPAAQTADTKPVPAPLQICTVLPAHRLEPGVQTRAGQVPLEQRLPAGHVAATTRPFTQL